MLNVIINTCFRFRYFRQLIWTAVLSVIFSLFAVVMFQSSNVATKPVGWEKTVRITPYGIKASNSKIASRGNLAVIVFEGNENGKTGVFTSVSFNNGTAFMKPEKIAETGTLVASNPSLADSGKGAVTVMWKNYDDMDSATRLFYSTSPDMGAT